MASKLVLPLTDKHFIEYRHVPFFYLFFIECAETDRQLAHRLRMQISMSKNVKQKLTFRSIKKVYFLFESNFISSTKNHRALIESLGHRRTVVYTWSVWCSMHSVDGYLFLVSVELQPFHLYRLFGIKWSTNIITTMDLKYAVNMLKLKINSKTKRPWSTMFVCWEHVIVVYHVMYHHCLCGKVVSDTSEWAAFIHTFSKRFVHHPDT